MSGKITQQEMENARRALSLVRDEWLQRSYVTAIDIGFHVEDGERREELAIRVHVRRDVADGAAMRAAFPEKIGRFPVDIITAEYGLQDAADE